MLIQCLSSCTRLSRQLITSPLYLWTGPTGRSYTKLQNQFCNAKNRLLTIKRPPERKSGDAMALRQRKTEMSMEKDNFTTVTKTKSQQQPQKIELPPDVKPPKIPVKKKDIKRLLSLVKSEKLVLTAAGFCLFVSSVITMSVPYSLGKILDIIFKQSEGDATMENLKYFCLVLLGVFAIGGMANYGRVYLFNNASIRIVKDMRSKVYRNMLKQEVGWFDTKGTGELVNRLSTDAYFMGNSLSHNLSDGLRSAMMIIIGSAMMIHTSPQLSLVSVCVVPCIASMAVLYGRYVRKLMRKYLDMHATIAKSAEERLGNIRTVKAFCKEKEEADKYDEMLTDAMKLAYVETKAKSVFYGLSGFSGNVVIISVLYYGGTLVISHDLTIGALTSFILYAAYSAVSINGLSNFYTELNRGVGSGHRVWEILDREHSIPLDVGIVPKNKPIGEVTFKNVIFNFPARPESPVLNNLSLTFSPGQTTAIVGRSGSGKTTIAGLLMRLYDPQSGEILLDGVNLKELNPSWLRHNIGAVSQEPVLFSGSIRENIMYGLLEGDSISEERFKLILEEAHVNEFANQLPQGLETIVGQRGVMLSGGQKQRVAIARALVKNPTILIFDEATSALDAVSEDLVQRALEKVSKGRTVLTIAHRLSTIRNADKIIVIEKGEVKEIGSYSELISKQSGVFKDLVKKQTFMDNLVKS